MCGPYGRCSITGQRCLSDIDCYGCQPSTGELSNTFLETNVVKGEDDAGKYSYLTPTYSELTTDVGTRAKLIAPSDKFTQPPDYNTGVNMWRAQFDEGESLYDKVYKPPANIINLPSYPPRYSLSGQFTENGPLASNAYLTYMCTNVYNVYMIYHNFNMIYHNKLLQLQQIITMCVLNMHQ
jgi:hypothetical protein